MAAIVLPGLRSAEGVYHCGSPLEGRRTVSREVVEELLGVPPEAMAVNLGGGDVGAGADGSGGGENGGGVGERPCKHNIALSDTQPHNDISFSW